MLPTATAMTWPAAVMFATDAFADEYVIVLVLIELPLQSKAVATIAVV